MPGGGDDMGAFLCWLAVRVLEMHRILKPTGSMYLHIDHTAQAYVKTMMDAIFGRENFRNAITWQRTSSHNDAKRYGNVTDGILYYVKNADVVFHPEPMPLDEEYQRKNYRHKHPKWGAVRLSDLTAPGAGGGESSQPWKGYDPASRGLHWRPPSAYHGSLGRWIEENVIPNYGSIDGVLAKLNALDDAGLIMWSKNGYPSVVRPLASTPGKKPTNLWVDIPPLSKQSKEKTGYPTQKPLALYERIIKASSNEGDIVLDPFAGCATTAVAAERLGRRWIAIDLNKEAKTVIRDRLKREVNENMNWNDDVQTSSTPPERTDGGAEAAPELILVSPKTKAPRIPLRELRERLVLADGDICQGCGFRPPQGRPEYLEVDHKKPKSLGGSDDMRNRVLLCPPCNGLKGKRLTLHELQQRRLSDGLILDAAWYERDGKYA